LGILLLLGAIAVACNGSDAGPTVPAATTAPAGATAVPAPTAASAGATAAPAPTATTAAGSRPAATRELVIATATPPPVPQDTPTPEAVVTSTSDRLVTALGALLVETNVPWHFAMLGMGKRPFYENLIGVDNTSGRLIPEIATEWGLSPDGLQWNFKLRKGVQFHYGWGEVTAKDIQHTFAVVTQEGAQGVDAKPLRLAVDRVEAVDDYTLIYHQKKPDGFSVEFYNFGGHGTSGIVSKAQWDAEGEEGYAQRMVGTGSWQYVDRILGQNITAARVVDHWRRTPEFEELEMLLTAEEATRLAALLAGEAHIVSLPSDLLKTATEQGMTLTQSSVPAVSYGLHFMGQYYYDPSLLEDEPWLDSHGGTLVRQAMNKAINRAELHQEIFQGRGEQSRVYGWHHTLLGYNSVWDEMWEEQYGYDPERAKELLAEAGYADGFELSITLVPNDLVPENFQIVEQVALYFEDIGLEVDLMPLDSGRWVEMFRKREMHHIVNPIAGSYRDPQFTISDYFTHDGIPATYVNEFTMGKYDELTSSHKRDDRDLVMRELGDGLYENFSSMPLFWFPAILALNPNVVAEYIFPGNRREIYSHLEYVKAADTR
jgi:ABC-type transport system substrate-binding protein